MLFGHGQMRGPVLLSLLATAALAAPVAVSAKQPDRQGPVGQGGQQQSAPGQGGGTGGKDKQQKSKSAPGQGGGTGGKGKQQPFAPGQGGGTGGKDKQQSAPGQGGGTGGKAKQQPSAPGQGGGSGGKGNTESGKGQGGTAGGNSRSGPPKAGATPNATVLQGTSKTSSPSRSAPGTRSPARTQNGARRRAAKLHRRALHRRALHRRALRLRGHALHRRALNRRAIYRGALLRRAPAAAGTALAGAAPVRAAAPAGGEVPRADGGAAQYPSGSERLDSRREFAPFREVGNVLDSLPGPVEAIIGLLLLLVLVFGLFSLVSGLGAWRLSRQRRELIADVGLLQEALLPKVPERLGGLVLSVAYRPASGPGAGGDFYEAFEFEGDRTGLVLGDVSGHGRDALTHAALLRYTMRAYLNAGLAPREALKLAGSVLEQGLDGDFATTIAAVFNREAGTLVFASAGHPPPIVLGPSAFEPVTAASAPPVGVGATTGQRSTTLALTAGSTVVFFTDGLIEAPLRGGGRLGRARLERIAAELGNDLSADALIAAVASESIAGADDMAVCVVRPAEPAAALNLRVEELELPGAEPDVPRAQAFLEACGLGDGEITELMPKLRDAATGPQGVLLRVRLGEWSPGVDILPAAPAVEDGSAVRLARVRA